MNLVILGNSILPYTSAIFSELGKLAKVHVLYLSAEDRMYGFAESSNDISHTYTCSVARSRLVHVPLRDARIRLPAFAVWQELRRLNPDVVFSTSWGAASWPNITGARAGTWRSVMWAESTSWSSAIRNPLARWYRRSMVRAFDSYVANGSQAALAIRDLGAKEERIVISRFASPWQSRVVPARPTRTLSSDARFLFVGRLIASKHPVEAIVAFSRATRDRPGDRLTIVGDGPLMGDCLKVVRMLGETRIKFVGRLEGNALIAQYNTHDILLCPFEREVWGLVVNEALSYGLFVVASNEVGSAHDLLSDDNGVMFAANDAYAFGNAIMTSVSRFAQVSKCPLDLGSPQQFARDMLHASELAMHGRR